MGIHLKDKYCIDTCLPFRLWSALSVFNQLANAIHLILYHQYGVHYLLHYLDDFIAAYSIHSNTCHQNLSQMLSLCDKIGVPIKTVKVEGPATFLTFLDIVLWRPVFHLNASITVNSHPLLPYISKCTKCELPSLIGKLSFTCKVVPVGCIFLCRIIDLNCLVIKLHHHIFMTNEVPLDL